MNHVLLTGATGTLGNRLHQALNQQDSLQIRGLCRNPATLESTDEWVQGDLLDPDSLTSAVEGIDTVVHLAALTHSSDEAQYFRVNLDGTRHLVQACLQTKIQRFIYISTRTAHPEGGAYAQSKLQAEEVVKASGLPWLILRPSEIYGAGSDDAIQQLIQWVQRFPIIPVIGSGKYTLNPLYIEDAIEGLVQAVLHSEIVNKTYDLSGPEDIPLIRLLGRIAKYFGVHPLKLKVPVPWVQWVVRMLTGLNQSPVTPDQIPRLLCRKEKNQSLAEVVPAFRPRAFEAGLKEAARK